MAAGLGPRTSALLVFAPSFSFYTTRITAPSTRDRNTLLQDLIKNSFMKTWPLLRGEKPQIAAVCVKSHALNEYTIIGQDQHLPLKQLHALSHVLHNVPA